jgi:hypothetical protein
MNTQSEQIAELAVALAKAQSENGIVIKDANNPYFKSKYATLAAVWESVRASLTKNGLSVVQMPSSDERGYYVETMLLHASGQWLKNRTYMRPVKDDPQGIGSLISYARRYALQAMTMVCPEDDDGEQAMGRDSKPVVSSQPVKKVETPKQVEKPSTEQPKAKAPAVSTSRFSGPSHQELFKQLIEAEITQDDFMEAMRHTKAIPANANDFFAMKEGTAEKFLSEIKTTIGVVREWAALVKP